MRIRQPISEYSRILLGAIGVILLMLVYSWLSHRQHLANPKDTTVPNLRQLVQGFVIVSTPRQNSLKSLTKLENKPETLWQKSWKTMIVPDVAATYGRLAKGMFLGCAISVALGVLMGCYQWLAALFIPVLSFLTKVPGTAMLAVFFLLAGTGEAMFITMIGFGILPVLTQSIYLSARDDLHHEEIDKAYTLGGSNFELIWEVVVPQIMPKVLDSVRLQLGPAMVYLIAAEMLVGQMGMGYQIRMQQRLLQMNIVYDYILILGTTGLLMDKFMLIFRQWYSPWFGRGR